MDALLAGSGLVAGCLLASLLWWILARRRRLRMVAELAERDSVIDEQQGKLQQLEKQLAITESRLDQLSTLESNLATKERDLSAAHRENATLKTQLQLEQQHYAEQLTLLKDAKAQLTKEFENLANKIFENKQQQFTQHSRTTLDGAINPLREQIKEFKKQVEDSYHKENAERNKLVGQITELQKQTNQIGQDAVNLATALRGSSKAQGNWGEVILERLLEESGLHKGREYETQVSLKDESGNRRNPDVIVRLPENKDIVIDAKVSLVDYETYCNCDDDNDKAAALKRHIASIRAHVDNLSRKNYESLEQIRSLDFVFIFVPIEAAFMLALEHEPGLFKYAYDKHIILVSPTTLLATLRTVENIWRYEKQNRNAERIAAMAGGLHDQFVLVMDSIEDLGQNIQRTQNAYEQTQKRMQTGRGNLVKRIRDLEKLGAKTKRRLAAVKTDDALLEDLAEESEEGADDEQNESENAEIVEK